tara:strand:- start:4589 stop:4858 length:270 start_codon:yes stop_codon:yes gene_type:complete
VKEQELAKALVDTKFTFAKSMPKIPHDWSARQDWINDEVFDKIVVHLRMYGIKERFFKKEYVYFYANGYKYWTMGNPIQKTRIINRAKT